MNNVSLFRCFIFSCKLFFIFVKYKFMRTEQILENLEEEWKLIFNRTRPLGEDLVKEFERFTFSSGKYHCAPDCGTYHYENPKLENEKLFTDESKIKTINDSKIKTINLNNVINHNETLHTKVLHTRVQINEEDNSEK